MDRFAELSQADERSLRFTPFGLLTGGILRPDVALEVHESSIAKARLVDAVPSGLRESFDRLRKRYLLGIIDYEQFTDVADAALTLYEPALRSRFIEFFATRDIHFAKPDGTLHGLRADDFDIVHGFVKENPRVKIQTSSGLVSFNGMLDGLMQWARAEGMLRGQRARGKERLVQKMRNRISHDRPYHILFPTEAVLGIQDLAEFINQLWGHPTPDGRIYPALADRQVLAIGWDRSGRTSFGHASNLLSDEDPDWSWLIVRAIFHDPELWHFDTRFSVTKFPSEYLWGPGSSAEAVRWIEANNPEPDAVDVVDQVFLIRHLGNRLHVPQSPDIVAALPEEERDGRWYLVRADTSNDAFFCVRSSLDRSPDHASGCSCATERLSRGSWWRMQKILPQVVPQLRPQLPPDVRINPSRRIMPRYVEVSTSSTKSAKK